MYWPRAGDIPALVRSVYLSVLDREPEPEGLKGWCAYLQNGGSIEILLKSFLNSEEYQKRAPSFLVPPPQVADGVRSSSLSIAIVGNCLVRSLARCIQALTGGPMPDSYYGTTEFLTELEASNVQLLRTHDLLLVQPYVRDFIARTAPDLLGKLLLFPKITFSGFHPDLTYVRYRKNGAEFQGPLGPYHSSLIFFGWRNGKTVKQILSLFNADVYRRLGFFDFMESSIRLLISEAREANLDLNPLLANWRERGCFMHSVNHPKDYVMIDLAKAILGRHGIPVLGPFAADYAYVDTIQFPAWPVYPEIASVLGVPGSYFFKQLSLGQIADRPVIYLDLQTMVEQSFEAYSKISADEIMSERIETDVYRSIMSPIQTIKTMAKTASGGQSQATTRSFYSHLAEHHFWRSAVENKVSVNVDPVLAPKFVIQRGDEIATAGSCFAQNIAQQLKKRGMRYMVSEPVPSILNAQEAERRQYDIYSARYGNVYSARQLLQLLQRAYGDFVPRENCWLRPNGNFSDPFRPEIEPEGFVDRQALERDRIEHLGAVRRMFESLDLFIFTLGLTEAWRAKRDGAVFPLAPGVVAGTADLTQYEFVNFGVDDVVSDLENFLHKLRTVNSRARVILTVSPVPLVATYENQHVLTATTYSKSVLRVAAEKVSRRHDDCAYFPAYEIIIGNFNRGAYYDKDLRSVTPAGVDHVMRLFFEHYAQGGREQASDPALLEEIRRISKIVCEEEKLQPTG